jgi:hypothetical protein
VHAETCGRDGVIASVRALIAGSTFLLDVGYFAIRGDFPVVAGNTPATESRESQETNQTVHANPRHSHEQFLYRGFPHLEDVADRARVMRTAGFSAYFRILTMRSVPAGTESLARGRVCSSAS